MEKPIIEIASERAFYDFWSQRLKMFGMLRANHDDFLNPENDLQIDIKKKRAPWKEIQSGTGTFRLGFNGLERHLKKPCEICRRFHAKLLYAFKFSDRKDFYVLEATPELLKREVIDTTWKQNLRFSERQPAIIVSLSELTPIGPWLQKRL